MKKNTVPKLPQETRAKIAALKLAIKCVTETRRAKYSAGNAAYTNGHHFDFAITAHKHYETYTKAINELESMLEAIQPPQENPMSKLEFILNDMLTEAKKRAGITARRKLQKGLGIEVTCISSEVRLTITRDNTYPSAAEWDTVKKCFPYHIPDRIAVVQEFKNHRYTISTKFPAQHVMQLKFD